MRHKYQQLFLAMGPPDSSSIAAMVALVCLLGILALVCIVQAAYVLRLRSIVARYQRDDSGSYSDNTYSRGRSSRRWYERDPSWGSTSSSQWSLDYGFDPYDRSAYNSPYDRPPYDGLPYMVEGRAPWDPRRSPARTLSREGSRYERMRRHGDLERDERHRLANGQPQSFIHTPTTYYGSSRGSSGNMAPALSSPHEGQLGRAGGGRSGPARPRPRRVESFPNLDELHAWGAACEAQGYVYDGQARGYAQPVCPEGYMPEDALYPARFIWELDLERLQHRAWADSIYVWECPTGREAMMNARRRMGPWTLTQTNSEVFDM